MSECFLLRVNRELKEDFFSFCKRKGLSSAGTVQLLTKKTIEKGVIPFSIDIDKMYANTNDFRLSIYMDKATKEKFADVCERYGLSVSTVLRAFMEYCVKNNRLPD